MGGVFFARDTVGKRNAFLWRHRFPRAVSTAVVSFDNPHGTSNNSKLELCGDVAHHVVVADTVDVRERTVWTESNNAANVCWMRKGFTTTLKVPACPLCIQGHHQRRCFPQHDCIPGDANTMADICLRAWHLTDSALLAHFDDVFPQTNLWTLCPLNSAWTSKLISALHKKPSAMASVPGKQKKRMSVGTLGQLSAWNTKLIPSCDTAWTRSPSSASLHSAAGTKDSPSAANLSNLNKWRQSSVRWARRSPAWGPATPGTLCTRLPSHPTVLSLEETRCAARSCAAHARHPCHLPPEPRSWRPRIKGGSGTGGHDLCRFPFPAPARRARRDHK